MPSIAALYRIHNCTALDYPLEASVRHSLILCDEVCFAAGQSIDGTMDIIFSLQREFGKDRVKFTQYEFLYNRLWQEKAWQRALKLTRCDWLFLVDADEAIHENHCRKVREMLSRKDISLINFPMAHFYGTPEFKVYGGHFYKRHTRIGRRSINFGMKNFRTDSNTAPVCDVVATLRGRETKVHMYGGRDILRCDIPIYHYGWVRNATAMMMRRIKGGAWYKDDKTYYDGHLPAVKEKFNYCMTKNKSIYEHYKGKHPKHMYEWFKRPPHPEEWAALKKEVADGA